MNEEKNVFDIPIVPKNIKEKEDNTNIIPDNPVMSLSNNEDLESTGANLAPTVVESTTGALEEAKPVEAPATILPTPDVPEVEETGVVAQPDKKTSPASAISVDEIFLSIVPL